MDLFTGQADQPTPNNMLRRESSGKDATRFTEGRRKSSAHNTGRILPSMLSSKRPSIVPNSNEFDLSVELTNAIMESDKALLLEAKKLNDVAGKSKLSST